MVRFYRFPIQAPHFDFEFFHFRIPHSDFRIRLFPRYHFRYSHFEPGFKPGRLFQLIFQPGHLGVKRCPIESAVGFSRTMAFKHPTAGTVNGCLTRLLQFMGNPVQSADHGGDIHKGCTGLRH